MGIRQTRIGPAALAVGAQGLGCLNLTGFYGKSFDRVAADSTIRAALELGVSLLDTADSYGDGADAGFGASERLVGRAIRDVHDRVVLASKFGFLPAAVAATSAPAGPRVVRADPAYVRSACDASLHRLGVDHIDLYFCHRLDAAVPVEETVGAMAELVTAGKVRHLGLSAVSASDLARATAVHPITAVESEWSLWSRDVEKTVLPTAREHGIAVLAYAPLGRGFLAGAVRSERDLAGGDQRRGSPRFTGDNLARNLRLLDHIESIAAGHGATLAQVALAWLHAQGQDVVPIPGADRPEFVRENAAAVDLSLSPHELRTLDEAFPHGAAAGARYSDPTHVRDTVGTDGQTP